MLIPPPILALGAAVAQRALNRHPKRPDAARAVVAAAVAAGSAAVAVAAAQSFRRAGTTLNPEDPEQASVLVTTGPHAASRNPMYLGLTGVLVAHAIRLRSWTALVPAAAFVAVIDGGQIRAEEQAMRDRFGADYEAYCNRVPRWLDRRSVDLARRRVAPARRPEAMPDAGSAGR